MASAWEHQAERQAGTVSRAQVLASGLSRSAVENRLLAGRWVRAYPGVYRTFTGPSNARADAWCAVLYAGAGATLDAVPSLWLAGVNPQPPSVWQVLVPADRRVRAQPGIRVASSSRLGDWRHSAASPPRLRVEAAVLRASDTCTEAHRVIDTVIAATGARLTTAARLESELQRWPRSRWRRLLTELVADVDDGVASALERRWRHDVEIAHGLPRGRRNGAEQINGRRRYRDLRYRPFALVAELDGRAAHPETGAFRDRERDNAAARDLELALRYGWHEVAADPCGCAAELAGLLSRRGWCGRPRPCGAACPITGPARKQFLS